MQGCLACTCAQCHSCRIAYSMPLCVQTLTKELFCIFMWGKIHRFDNADPEHRTNRLCYTRQIWQVCEPYVSLLTQVSKQMAALLVLRRPPGPYRCCNLWIGV